MNYIDRMKAEYNELNEKKQKLDAFIESDKFDDINGRGKRLMIEQCAYMKQYLDVLNTRLWLAHGNS